ncbi:MAG: FlgD immunoglobulin-like domain containing protein [Ignavibacteriaceae bacterium]|nr:FlgD immunoglobulin-like domain containing protein [Ignavibacteriaceae bacterium]
MKSYFTFLFVGILSLVMISKNYGQSYQGPAAGSVPFGVVQSTDSFLKSSGLSEPKEVIGNEEADGYHTPDFNVNNAKPEGSNYIKGVDQLNGVLNSSSILLKSFNGMPMTNSIPPDPHSAAGPNYVVTTVNTQFAIFDKDGNKIKTIDGVNWVSLSDTNPSVVTDPKVIYDHFSNRFVLVWLTINTTTAKTYWVVSVSHDSTPLGTWYTWALPSNLNGTTDAKNYGDYEGLGYDKDCIYITGNMFSISGGTFQYSKLRIIPKAQLYANNAGAVNWTDIWGITIPGSSQSTFGLRPAIIYGSPSEYYLIYGSNGSGSAFSVFKLTNPLTNSPGLTGVNIPVTFYGTAPDVNQLGGSGSNLIDGGTSQIRNEPVFRDGFLWAVHSVRNPVSSIYSSIHYVKINIASGSAVEDYVFGDPGFWHNYPAVMVDQDQNMAITYSQSDTGHYIGAYYTSRLVSDPVGLQPSKPLQTGKGNYVVTFSGTKNRWGDYMGISLDPTDNYNIWMFTEYAAATNQWGTWVGELRLTPSPHIYSDITSVNFGYAEINHTSDTIPVILKNAGLDNVIISNISKQSGPFTLTDNFSYPKTISSSDSLIIHLVFNPVQVGTYNENLIITSNDNNYPGMPLIGTGYIINAAVSNTLYASSGTNDSGKVLTINPLTGIGSAFATSLFSEIRSIAIHPKTKIIYGISSNTINSGVLRINSATGDAYTNFTLPLADMGAIAFDTAGTLYAGMHSGLIYTINLQTREFTKICSLKVKIQSLAFNPATNELWGTPLVALGISKDRIFKVNLATGDTIVVGQTGFSIATNAIAFDNSGNLYAVNGATTAINNLIALNKQNAIGTLIGSIGYRNITGISFSPSVTSVNDQQQPIPVAFNLMQNYPNPFNPSTTIEYSIPSESNVKITIYNILGDVVKVVFNSFRNAGNYKTIWNGIDGNGNKVSSGVYFYELKAVTGFGSESVQMKKMILLK